MSDEPKHVVARGYDAVAERYADWAASFESPTLRWVEKLLDRLDEGSKVLELGCGGGAPATQRVAERHELLGIDISARQIDRARQRVPNATFRRADVTELTFEDGTFDAVVTLYMLGHVPRDEQGPLLASMAGWLRPEGLLLATMGTSGAEDEVEEDWLGAPMFFASFDEETNRKLLADPGFEVIEAKVIPIEEPGHGLVSFMWILARKP